MAVRTSWIRLHNPEGVVQQNPGHEPWERGSERKEPCKGAAENLRPERNVFMRHWVRPGACGLLGNTRGNPLLKHPDW